MDLLIEDLFIISKICHSLFGAMRRHAGLVITGVEDESY